MRALSKMYESIIRVSLLVHCIKTKQAILFPAIVWKSLSRRFVFIDRPKMIKKNCNSSSSYALCLFN